MEKPKFISHTIGELASRHGYSIPTFWANFTPMHFHDMIELGYQLGRLKLNPLVVEYVERVVMKRESREEFEQLRGKSFR